MDNLFFDLSELKSCGKNVIIGKTVRIRYPELVEIEDNVIIDDFTYISTSLKVCSYVHIASGCKLIGGRECSVEMQEFTSLSPNVVLSAGSDDYVNGIATPIIPEEFKGGVTKGKIIMEKHALIGANSVVLPNVTFFEGARLAALSLATTDLESYTLYGGIPARVIRDVNKTHIAGYELRFREFIEQEK
ncbi:MAG: hypothetical protein NTV58_17855 [Deltaproteobacteria bacterium]|nr:hypothetical protein [Deltaproteobacteria bacterium]